MLPLETSWSISHKWMIYEELQWGIYTWFHCFSYHSERHSNLQNNSYSFVTYVFLQWNTKTYNFCSVHKPDHASWTGVGHRTYASILQPLHPVLPPLDFATAASILPFGTCDNTWAVVEGGLSMWRSSQTTVIALEMDYSFYSTWKGQYITRLHVSCINSNQQKHSNS